MIDPRLPIPDLLVSRPEDNQPVNAVKGGRILYLQYTNPAAYPPLQHSSRILANSNFHVIVLGTEVAGLSALRFTEHERITVKLLPSTAVGWRQKLHYFRFTVWALLWTLRWRPDWIYASDLLACPGALLISFVPGVRVIYHEHDSPSPSNQSLFQQIARYARSKLARRAEFCI